MKKNLKNLCTAYVCMYSFMPVCMDGCASFIASHMEILMNAHIQTFENISSASEDYTKCKQIVQIPSILR